jgi:hypothetical protein
MKLTRLLIGPRPTSSRGTAPWGAAGTGAASDLQRENEKTVRDRCCNFGNTNLVFLPENKIAIDYWQFWAHRVEQFRATRFSRKMENSKPPKIAMMSFDNACVRMYVHCDKLWPRLALHKHEFCSVSASTKSSPISPKSVVATHEIEAYFNEVQ